MDPLLGNFKPDSEILHNLELKRCMYSKLYTDVNQEIKKLKDSMFKIGIEILDFQTMIEIENDEVVNSYVIDFGQATEIKVHEK